MIEIKDLENFLEQVSLLSDSIYNFSKYAETFEKYYNNMEKYKSIFEKYYEKFSKNILEVAIAGLEKSGKSALANAIIGEEVLPSKVERATYVITQIKYGKEFKVEVDFYSSKEFQENLVKLLKENGIEDAENYNLDNLSALLERLEAEDNKIIVKNTTLKEELKEIIENREVIKEFLGKQREVLTKGDEEIYKSYITHPGKSRAIKRITIYTPTLENLKNVIIYDLPGFDSPTEIHKKYTMDMLKNADAILFVRRAADPSLKDPEVKIFSRVEEDDGIKLKDKLFFFLNKVDELETTKKIKEVVGKFKAELKKYNLFISDDRIFIGSIKAYLYKKGIDKSEEAEIVFERIKKLGLSEDILEEILKSLEEYNKTERRKILEIRLVSHLKHFLEEIEKIRQSLEPIQDENELLFELRLKDEVMEKLERAINVLNVEISRYIKDIKDSKTLSQKILEKYDLEINMLTEEEYEPIKNRVEIETYSSDEPKTHTYNIELRKKLFEKTRDLIHQLPEEIVLNEQERLKNKVIEIITRELNVEKQTDFKEKLEEFIDNNLRNYLNEIYGIKVIFMRFIGNFMELLIKHPRNSPDRRKVFRAIHKDFSFFLGLSGSNHLKYEHNTTENDVNKKKEIIDEILNYVKKEGLMSRFLGLGINLEDYDINFLEKLLKEVKLKAHSKDDEMKISESELYNLINKVEKETGYSYYSSDSATKEMKNFIEKEKEILSNPDEPKNFEAVERETEEDLKRLKLLIKETIMSAINPEEAFNIVARDFVNKFSQEIKGPAGKEFLNETLELIYFSQFKNAEERERKRREAAKIIDILTDIRKVAEKLKLSAGF